VLSISPESFRIAAGLVLAAAAVRTIVWPVPAPAPFAAVLVTPELAALAVSLGADEPADKVFAAAVPAFVLLALAYRARRRDTAALSAQFLAALQLVVAVALVVAGIRDV
jgi:small neutral amino acid transporter SnatA (MarC family)